MKSKTLSLLFTSIAILSACTKGNETSKAHPHLLSAKLHNSDTCPNINGKFTRNEEKEMKEVSTEAIEGGVKYTDTQVEWIIDGKNHALKESNGQLTYLGVCTKGQLVVELYKNDRSIGQLTARLTSEATLEIETSAYETKSKGSLETEVWQLKKN